MRALIAGLGALTVLMTVGCADQGNLMIRCPDAGGELAVTDGQVTIDGVVMRVAADLNEPSSPEKGLTFAINVQLPALPSDKAAPSVECVRLRMPQQNAQWDATATRRGVPG